jgi:hypothetical protein
MCRCCSLLLSPGNSSVAAGTTLLAAVLVLQAVNNTLSKISLNMQLAYAAAYCGTVSAGGRYVAAAPCYPEQVDTHGHARPQHLCECVDIV